MTPFLPEFLLSVPLKPVRKMIPGMSARPQDSVTCLRRHMIFAAGTKSILEKSRLRPTARVARRCQTCIVLDDLTSFDHKMPVPSPLWSLSLRKKWGPHGARVYHQRNHRDTTSEDFFPKEESNGLSSNTPFPSPDPLLDGARSALPEGICCTGSKMAVGWPTLGSKTCVYLPSSALQL